MEKHGDNAAPQDGKNAGGEEVKTGELSRREFLKWNARAAGLSLAAAVGGLGLAAVARPLLDLLGGDQGKIAEEGILDQLQPEELQSIKDKAWGDLTEVLNGHQFSGSTLSIKQIEAVKGHNPEIAKEEIQIQGSLRGIGEGSTSEVGVNFTLTFAKGSDPDVLGLRTGSDLGIGIFRGENAGDVQPSSATAFKKVNDPQDMKRRFEDITSMLKKVLNIPDTTPFIPMQDFNGLVTFVNEKDKPGYGLLIHSVHGIDGKGVTIKVIEGLLTDIPAWISTGIRVAPGKISFIELLKTAIAELGDKNTNVFSRTFPYVKNAPAAEYISQLGEQYLPNQAIQAEAR